MKIDHIAIWTDDIETMRDFYLTYFDVTCGNKYVNPIKNFTSYFLSFGRWKCPYRTDDKTRNRRNKRETGFYQRTCTSLYRHRLKKRCR